MIEKKKSDKISGILRMNKKTAFDWRHKILLSLSNNQVAVIVTQDRKSTLDLRVASLGRI